MPTAEHPAKTFDVSMTWFQTAKRFLIIFGFLWLLLLARLSSRVADPLTFYIFTLGFALIVLLGTYFRYAWYFKRSFLTIDDTRINWHRSDEDHVFQIPDITGVRLPNKIAQYYGLSYLSLRFRAGPALNLDPMVPGYDEIIEELVARIRHYPHLSDIVTQIEEEGE